MDNKWQWVYRKPTARESGSLVLHSPSGAVAATVFTHPNGGHGHCWYVWDEDGIGGENSAAPTIDAAIMEAETAVLRWGKIRD